MQQDHSVQRLGGSYPQNQFRQASLSTGSAQNRSFDTQTVANSGFSQRFSSSGFTQTVSQPALYDVAFWQQANVQKKSEPRFLHRHTPISSGSSISVYNKRQNGLSNGGQSTWTVQRGTQRPSNGASVHSPSREKYSFTSSQSTAQKPYGSAAKTPGCNVQKSLPSRADAPTMMQTVSCSLGRRVHSHRHSGAFNPFRSRKTPNQQQLYQSQLSAVNGGNAQGSYKPPSNMAPNHVSYNQLHLELPYRQNALSFEPYGLQFPIIQDRLSSSFTGMGYGQASWNNKNPAQVAYNLVSEGSRVDASAQHSAPVSTHVIPQVFGGQVIRRLKRPSPQRVSVLKPQRTYKTPPLLPVSYRLQTRRTKWLEVKPRH